MESLVELLRGLVESYGYAGIFIVAFTESIIQPVPPDPFIAGATALGLDPLLSALVATAGSVSGGLVAYGLGRLVGETFVRKLVGEERYERAERLYDRWGFFAVLVAGLTPIPYKVFAWLSGILELGVFKFLVASVLGRFPRFLGVALLGDAMGGLL